MPFSSSRKGLRKKKKLKKEYEAAKQAKRQKLLNQDRLKLAKHYEELKLFEESIKYYKLLELEDEVKRVSEIKFNTYLPKAKEFEARGSYEDALRLYEQLNMIDDVNRVKAKMGEPTTDPEPEEEGAEPGNDDDDDDIIVQYDETEFQEENDIDWDKPNVFRNDPQFEEDEDEGSVKKSKKRPGSSGKVFLICPYCGEELNLPKQPNFCPFCKEPFK